MKMYETVSRLLKDQTEDRPLDISVDVVRDLFQYLIHDSGMWYVLLKTCLSAPSNQLSMLLESSTPLRGQ